MRLRFLLSVITVLVATGVVLPYGAHAASPSSILVDTVPENPAPGENVTITLNSYVSNLDSVLITWSVNGKNALSGIGKKSFSTTAPASGGETDVVATVSLPDGAIYTKVVIRPSVMVLLWQADDSYVPPFYRGKALPTPQSEIKVVAMPEIKNGGGIVNPKSVVYAWKKDYQNDQADSGYGKNFLTYTSDYLDSSSNISVTASTTDQKYSSDASVDLETYEPKILFYKNDPARGTLWEQALTDGHQVFGSEIIQAAPYFISPADIRIPTLVFHWFINDVEIAVPSVSKNVMPVAVPAGTTGVSEVKLEIESTDKIFETAQNSINLQF